MTLESEPDRVNVNGSDSRFMSWRFRAQDTGGTLLKFRYGRPWETAAETGRTETFLIDVR